jgi:hypothetical protein
MNVDKDYLRQAIRNKTLVPVVGAGFAQATTAGLPSWSKLLDLGIEYLRTNKLAPAITIRAIETSRRRDPLVKAFDKLQEAMRDTTPKGKLEHYKSDTYKGFLNDIFEDVEITSTSLATAIRALNPRVVLTTNYDNLLQRLEVTLSKQAVTWEAPSRIRSVLRAGSGVIHLHGAYHLPRSVIMSDADYTRLVKDDDATMIARAIFQSGVLLFIGSSVDGISDPHMGKILAEFGRLASKKHGEDAPHIALFDKKPSGTQIAKLRNFGIEVMATGSHAETPQFLKSLVTPELINVTSTSVRTMAESLLRIRSRGSGLQSVAEFIKKEIFPGRDIDISFAEKQAGRSASLLTKYVKEGAHYYNKYNYPRSIAAWSLIEGRIIALPEDMDTPCDIRRVRDLGKTAVLAEIPKIKKELRGTPLVVGSLWQKNPSGLPQPEYAQHLCVPVPIVDPTSPHLSEYGVFNIATNEDAALRDARTVEQLKLASTFASVICRRYTK